LFPFFRALSKISLTLAIDEGGGRFGSRNPCSTVGLAKGTVLEMLFAFDVLGNGVAVSMEFVLIGREPLQAHWTACMQLIGANAELSAETIAISVGKAR